MAVLNDGALHQVGTAQELYDRPADRFVAGFIGIMNLIEDTLDDEGAVRGR